MVNTKKLKERMAELNLTQKDVAEYLKMAQPTINQKINNTRPMCLDEADRLAELLRLSDSEYAIYFFAKEIA